MDEELKIVRGNDFYLRVPVRMKYLEHGTRNSRVIKERDCPLGECSEVEVYVVDSCGCKRCMPFTIEGKGINVLVVHVEHCLCAGRYGIEIQAKYDGRQMRCYERRAFRLVEDDGKSYLTPAVFEGGQEYILTTMWMLWAAPSYPELHLELNGMRLVMTGTVDCGEMRLDEQGRLVLIYN